MKTLMYCLAAADLNIYCFFFLKFFFYVTDNMFLITYIIIIYLLGLYNTNINYVYVGWKSKGPDWERGGIPPRNFVNILK